MAGNTTPPLVTELTLQDINKATLALSKQIQPAGSGSIVGTSISLAQQNPTLAAGQIGYETDTKFFKIGDGTTAYNSLSYQAKIPVAPLPQSAVGVGQWIWQAPGTGNSFVLPAGGTWGYFFFQFIDATGVWNNANGGIAAGGTTVGVGSAGKDLVGLCWRIA